ncbi:arginine decarboxylase [Fibrobacter intestinalis]|uniref:Biosynthetic arginine decarboxylase n=1 Tax=Fibrobacter intestinalis TaxID=28122 RepID=A0A1M6R2L7_9BACT|nr:biosynthetic arginine decarboxylase [Fibrobacter intestinalis]MDD7298348.1 biosynthetic arginine decarboxylase [Fibrobacter intestinalis]SHK26587.1 arginine decarboxylase [Fibrobacter intestinalis]
MKTWRIDDSRDLYNIRGWGINYFDINEEGHATVCPLRTKGPSIDLFKLVQELDLLDMPAPILLRFPDILDMRIEKINECFNKSIQEYGFKGSFYDVFPIKVNQQRAVLEEVVRHGKKFNIGLEAGSKPELHAVLANMDNPNALIICNGYKDEDFIELALLAQKMGKNIYVVVEKITELPMIIEISRRIGVKPNIGLRIKLASSGQGKWEESGGYNSKFGLSSSELLNAMDLIRQENMCDCVKLIHCHLGSQITNIRKIKSGLREISEFYVQLKQLGMGVEFVDVGGGLGVDYDGSRSAATGSVNYSIQEYANDIVYSIFESCEKFSLPHPNVIAETGRALSAHHSVLVFNVLETAGPEFFEDGNYDIPEGAADSIKDLYAILKNLNVRNLLENWHDALQINDDILSGFRMGGAVDLKTRALAERLFWSIARRVHELSRELRHSPMELAELPRLLARKYFCNFSLFQSLPDSWAIDQIFPIMPIQRLNEAPTVDATLQDITCDSDGKIDMFVSGDGVSRTLPVHNLKPGEPYYLAVYLVGAYQEILGDLHNLFGDTNAVHVVCDGDGYRFDQMIDGESVEDVLDYVNFSDKALVRTMENWVSTSVKEGKISLQEGKEFLNIYRSGLYGYTYLEE